MTKNLHISMSIFFFYFVLEFMLPLSVAFARYFSLSYYGLVYIKTQATQRDFLYFNFSYYKKIKFQFELFDLILDS